MRTSTISRAVPGILLTLALVACGDDVTNVGMQTIEKGYDSGIILDAPQLWKIDSQAQWDDFWARHQSNRGTPDPQPAVDFSRYGGVAVVDRQQPSGGFAMEIVSVTAENGALHVHATRKEPGAGCVVLTMLTQPYHIVRIDKSALPAVLELSAITVDCSP